MAIDAATRESLELTCTAAGPAQGQPARRVDRTVTGAGARLLAADLGAPLMDRAAIDARLELVAALPRRRRRARAAARRLRALPDIGRALGRLAAGRGCPRDLGQLRDGLDGAWRLGERLAGIDARPALLAELAPALRGHGALIDLLAPRAGPSPPIDASNGGYIAEGYDAALDDAARRRRRRPPRDRRAGGRARRRRPASPRSRSATTTCSAIMSRCPRAPPTR